MNNSSTTSAQWNNVELSDIFNHPEQVASIWSDLISGAKEDPSDWLSTSNPFPSIPTLSALKHARNRSSFRWLGAIDPSGTAEPETGAHSNQYLDLSSRLESRIREFLLYSENWDGDGAEEIPLNAIYTSLNFVNRIRNHFHGHEPKSAAPSPEGEIVLYWHNPSGYAEVNFDGSGNISLCWGGENDIIEVLEEAYEGFEVSEESRVWSTLQNFLDEKGEC